MRLNHLLAMKMARLEESKLNTQQHASHLQAVEAKLASSTEQHLHYQRWRKEEQDQLFDRCKGQVMDSRTLEQWRQANASMREKEARLVQAMIVHAQALTAAQESLRACERQLHDDQLQVEKFSRLNVQLQATRRKLLQHREEEELDEIHRPEALPE